MRTLEIFILTCSDAMNYTVSGATVMAPDYTQDRCTDRGFHVGEFVRYGPNKIIVNTSVAVQGTGQIEQVS